MCIYELIKGCRETAVSSGCNLVHLSDRSDFTYYMGLNRKRETDRNDSAGVSCITCCTDGEWHACVYC